MAWQGGGLAASLVWAAVCSMSIMMTPGLVHGQGVIPPTPAPKAIRGPETNVIPSLTLSERYDSNVFFVPGSNLEDYVTTVSPQLRVIHQRQLVAATVGGGATAEVYAKNPGLNYVAANGLVDLNLDGAMSEMVRGMGLRISDTFYYTPQVPSFAAPTGGGGQISESFVRGIQARRANSFTNVGTVAGSYAMTPLVTLTSTYSNSYIHFGSTIAPPAGSTQPALINTMFQTVNSGPQIRLSPIDTVTLLHQYQQADYGGSIRGFSSQGGTAGWTRVLTQTLTSSLTGGGTLLSQSDRLQLIGSASLMWNGENTDAMVSYSRAVHPGFIGSGTAMLSQVVTVNAGHHITQAFSVSINGNYAFNQSTPDSSLQQFTSYSVTPNVAYQINRVMTATLSYTRSHFEQTFSSQESSFDRNIVLLRLFAEWK